MNRIRLGAYGENLCATILQGVGIPLERNRVHNGDLSLMWGDSPLINIEIKTAQKGKDGKYRFTLKTAESSTGSTNVWTSNVDYVILVVKDDIRSFPYFYVIPRESIPTGKGHIVITSHPLTYQGRYKEYLVNDLRFILKDYLDRTKTARIQMQTVGKLSSIASV